MSIIRIIKDQRDTNYSVKECAPETHFGIIFNVIEYVEDFSLSEFFIQAVLKSNEKGSPAFFFYFEPKFFKGGLKLIQLIEFLFENQHLVINGHSVVYCQNFSNLFFCHIVKFFVSMIHLKSFLKVINILIQCTLKKRLIFRLG